MPGRKRQADDGKCDKGGGGAASSGNQALDRLAKLKGSEVLVSSDGS